MPTFCAKDCTALLYLPELLTYTLDSFFLTSLYNSLIIYFFVITALVFAINIH